MPFTHFIELEEKLEIWSVSPRIRENVLALNPELFCQKIDSKTTHW